MQVSASSPEANDEITRHSDPWRVIHAGIFVYVWCLSGYSETPIRSAIPTRPGSRCFLRRGISSSTIERAKP